MKRQLRRFGHTCRVTETSITKRIYETKAQGRNKRRSARRTFIQGIQEEAEKKGITWEGTKEMTQNRYS